MVNGDVQLFASVNLFARAGNRLVMGSKRELSMISAESGVLSYTQDIYSFRGNFPVSFAALQGESFPETVFALVPQAARESVVVLKLKNEPWTLQVADFSPPAACCMLLPNEDGTRYAMLAYDAAGRPVEWRILDLEAITVSEAMAAEEGWQQAGALMFGMDNRIVPAAGAIEQNHTLCLALSGEKKLQLLLEEDGGLIVRDETPEFRLRGGPLHRRERAGERGAEQCRGSPAGFLRQCFGTGTDLPGSGDGRLELRRVL